MNNAVREDYGAMPRLGSAGVPFGAGVSQDECVHELEAQRCKRMAGMKQ
jgi:hypothetical protein